ncbi:hypothetical protein [Sphingomonas sp.]|jgi:hypothetical protein|uniref:hypothetical protein n=1 Tax=Sphingomonas sp. TaxID=28214 RepID=UPI002EDA1C64
MNTKNPAQRRYIVRFVPAMLAYVIVLFACSWAIRVYQPEGAALYALAALPSLPILAVLAVMGLYLAEERDEFIRNRLVTAMMGGIGITLAITSVWGFLEEGADVTHFPTFLAFPIWCGAFGLVQCAMSLRDRMAGSGQ